ncbi:MAG: hypothetical protein RH917_20430 [Lacipirellulaceae bacterium]
MANRSHYRCVATSIEGFLFQLAVSYVTNGKYYFYVQGSVPSWRTPAEHDSRMLSQYDVAISKFARCRRRKRIGNSGRHLANCQYLRFSNFWILLCQEGENAFFERNCRRDADGAIEEQWFCDVRKSAIQFNEYSVGFFNDKLTVRLTSKAMAGLRSYYLGLALKPLPYLREELATFPYEAYGGVLKQRYSILRSMNLKRGAAGLPAIPTSFIKKRRKPVKPFEPKGPLIRKTSLDLADLSLAA